jgi:Holliday junction resolvase
MGGAMSRRKGKVGELEVCALLRDHGLKAQRTAPLQAAGGVNDADIIGVDGFHLEIKRAEAVSIDKWCAQAELAAKPTDTPCVVWRRSRQPWRVALSLNDFLDLVKQASL